VPPKIVFTGRSRSALKRAGRCDCPRWHICFRKSPCLHRFERVAIASSPRAFVPPAQPACRDGFCPSYKTPSTIAATSLVSCAASPKSATFSLNDHWPTGRCTSNRLVRRTIRSGRNIFTR